ncbi:MAG: hypothetical protein ACOX5F_11070 [Anaerovoracaceae bacterium]
MTNTSGDEILNKLKNYNNCCYINDIYSIISNSINKKGKSNVYYHGIAYLIFLTSSISSFLLLCINLVLINNVEYNKKIGLARVPRTMYKMERVKNDLFFITDDIKKRDFTMYQMGTRRTRIQFIINEYFTRSLRDFNKIYNILIEEELSEYLKTVMYIMAIRIPHSVVYDYAIDHVMSNYLQDEIYTGQMYDRFALIEDKLAKKYNIKLICYPHGIETTKKMPAGYIGDVFYCSSDNMAKKLNSLYNTAKYIFDETVLVKMYSINTGFEKNDSDERKIIFFTQPLYTQETKEIINNLVSALNEINIRNRVYIKTHPNESDTSYKIGNIEFIDKFDDAIYQNICISLASTVLLEAIYNKSISISIVNLIESKIALTNNYEFLNDKRILKPKDEKSLIDMIIKYL